MTNKIVTLTPNQRDYMLDAIDHTIDVDRAMLDAGLISPPFLAHPYNRLNTLSAARALLTAPAAPVINDSV